MSSSPVSVVPSLAKERRTRGGGRLHSTFRSTLVDAKPEANQAVILAAVFLQVAQFGIIAQALPAGLMQRSGGALAAERLGHLGSANAMARLVLIPTCGHLVDVVGPKPLLLLAPAVATLARGCVYFTSAYAPGVSITMELISAFVTSLTTMIWWMANRAMLADHFGHDTTLLATMLSRVAATIGLSHCIASLVGGYLTAIRPPLAYGASACVSVALVLLCFFGIPESERRPKSAPAGRVWAMTNPFVFLNGFKRGSLSVLFTLLVMLQEFVKPISSARDGIWQVIAREHRGWSAAQCGQFASVTSLAQMGGNLLTQPVLGLVGARGFTIGSNAMSVLACLLYSWPTPASLAIVPQALGTGGAQALTARLTTLGKSLGISNGQLAAEYQSLNAAVSMVAPLVYASFFRLGADRGLPSLPLYCSIAAHAITVLLALSIPSSFWTQKRQAE
ncbi:hypothetical protein Ctob_003793 [Chrysochromulina tobinii]|uniref:Uncharacterized protein n=1 Tax=Chrysochromulina tobinii TaxID=1460289 RepID=A0A0M0JLK8_9EUKA|nr:hypothetical protein Ctob_003793 [Chrysochromulina tobinii]|eukprot:KOO27222.1 hypothetical protein Ctob_003793 [Chrysochromulina sp. CCMP291]